MKKKIVVITTFLIFTQNSYTSMSPFQRARNMVRGAEFYYEKTLPLLYEYLRSVGLFDLATEIETTVKNTKNLEATVEADLIQKMNPDEQAALAIDKRNLEIYRILMNAKVPDEINRLFNTLDNIAENAMKEVVDSRKEIASITPKKMELENRIKNLQSQIDNLKKEIDAIMRSVTPRLNDYFEKIKKSTDSLFQQVKRIGEKIKLDANKEFFQVSELNKKIENLKKTRVDKTLQKNLEDSNKKFEDLITQAKNRVSQQGQAEAIKLGKIIDLLNRVEKTIETIMFGPGKIEQWNLADDILGINPPKTEI